MQEQATKPKKQKHPAIIYLRQYAAMKLRRDDLKEELLSIRERATSTTAQLSDERVSGSGAKDKIGTAAVQAVDVEARLEKIIRNLDEALSMRVWLIEQMQSEWEKTILTERYINGREWEDILNRIPFERTYMFKLHGYALQHFWEVHAKNNQVCTSVD